MNSIIGCEPFSDVDIARRHPDPNAKHRVDLEDLEEFGLISFDERSGETPFDHLFDSGNTTVEKLARQLIRKD